VGAVAAAGALAQQEEAGGEGAEHEEHSHRRCSQGPRTAAAAAPARRGAEGSAPRAGRSDRVGSGCDQGLAATALRAAEPGRGVGSRLPA